MVECTTYLCEDLKAILERAYRDASPQFRQEQIVTQLTDWKEVMGCGDKVCLPVIQLLAETNKEIK